MAETKKKKTTEKAAPALSDQRLVTATMLAKYLGKSIRRIQALTQDGIIETLPGGNTRARRYDLDETLKTYIKYLEEKAYGKAQADNEIRLKEKKLAAEAALKESQADIHKIKTDIARGKYIPVEEVELDYKKFFSIFKKFATAIPNRVAVMIGSQIDPVEARKVENDLAEEINRMLRTFVSSASARPAPDQEGDQDE